MGRVFLGESVSRRSMAAIGLLLVSLVLLGMAAWVAGKRVSTESGLLIALAVGAACMAGAIYALLMIIIRRTVTGTTTTSAIVFITTLIGVLTLGPLSVCRLGARELLATPLEQVFWMLAAGTLNLVAFLAITKGLQLTTVVHANLLNASQVAMAAIAGITLFPAKEHPNAWLLAGVGLTILGVMLVGRPHDGDQDADQHV
jgi:drug/metabolite transporter (DMT)-like permease